MLGRAAIDLMMRVRTGNSMHSTAARSPLVLMYIAAAYPQSQYLTTLRCDAFVRFAFRASDLSPTTVMSSPKLPDEASMLPTSLTAKETWLGQIADSEHALALGMRHKVISFPLHISNECITLPFCSQAAFAGRWQCRHTHHYYNALW